MDMLSSVAVFFAIVFSYILMFVIGFMLGFRNASKVALDTLDEMIREKKDELLAIGKEKE